MTSLFKEIVELVPGGGPGVALGRHFPNGRSPNRVALRDQVVNVPHVLLRFKT